MKTPQATLLNLANLFCWTMVLGLLCMVSCRSPQPRPYHTQHDSARYYYQKGWEQIMAQGFYGPAETSYRKALSFDPRFWVGKSVLARLSLDLNERLALKSELDSALSFLEGDERLLLEVYLALTHYTNLRDQASQQGPQALQRALSLAEQNFGQLIRKYPEEVYLKAEYLEIIHSRHGAQAALDTLLVIASSAQKSNPFIQGFTASLWAEVGAFEKAQELAQMLEAQCDTSWPKAYAVWADIYVQMDRLDLAEPYARKANLLDPRNLDASRLLAKILSHKAQSSWINRPLPAAGSNLAFHQELLSLCDAALHYNPHNAEALRVKQEADPVYQAISINFFSTLKRLCSTK